MAMIKEQREKMYSIIPDRLLKGGSIPIEIGEMAYADLSTVERWAKNLPRFCRALHI